MVQFQRLRFRASSYGYGVMKYRELRRWVNAWVRHTGHRLTWVPEYHDTDWSNWECLNCGIAFSVAHNYILSARYPSAFGAPRLPRGVTIQAGAGLPRMVSPHILRQNILLRLRSRGFEDCNLVQVKMVMAS